jgi:polyhydroxybutyrate depolymerase
MRVPLVVFHTLVLGAVTGAQAQMEAGFVTHERRERAYYVHTPMGYDETSPLPLLIALHPSGTSGAAGMASLTGFNEIAERDNFIVVYPIGPNGYWDYGAGSPQWAGVDDALDDPGYLSKVLDEVTAEYAVDPQRIYAAGFSNGARMAFRLACDRPDILAGIAAVAATISDDVTSACPTENHVSILFMHGTGDRVIPWEGKRLHIGDLFISTALSAPETARFWAELNDCSMEPTIELLPDSNPDDRLSIRRDLYSECADATEVAFYRMVNGGHWWFQTPDFNVSEVIWSFFEAHPRATS